VAALYSTAVCIHNTAFRFSYVVGAVGCAKPKARIEHKNTFPIAIRSMVSPIADGVYQTFAFYESL
jgi:hypothetical protein